MKESTPDYGDDDAVAAAGQLDTIDHNEKSKLQIERTSVSLPSNTTLLLLIRLSS